MPVTRTEPREGSSARATRRPGGRRRLLTWGARAVGVGLLVYLGFTQIDWSAFWSLLAGISGRELVLLLVLATVDRFLMAIKWRQLLAAVGPTPGLGTFVRAYYGASFLNYLLPTSLGGEVYRGVRLSSHVDPPRVLASLVMERVMGVLSVVLLAWVGVAILVAARAGAGASELRVLVYALAAVSLVLVLGLAGSLSPAVHGLARRLAARFRTPRLLARLSNAYGEYASRRAALTVNGVLAVVENTVLLLLVFACARVLDVQTPTLLLLSAIAVSEFARRASIVLDGWGLGTAVYIVLLGLAGITAAQALAITLTSHAAVIAATLPGGVLLLVERRQGLEFQPERGAESTPAPGATER